MGDPTYAWLAVASLGHEALTTSVVGNDGHKALESLKSPGVSTETELVMVVRGAKSTGYEIVQLKRGNRELRTPLPCTADVVAGPGQAARRSAL